MAVSLWVCRLWPMIVCSSPHHASLDNVRDRPGLGMSGLHGLVDMSVGREVPVRG